MSCPRGEVTLSAASAGGEGRAEERCLLLGELFVGPVEEPSFLDMALLSADPSTATTLPEELRLTESLLEAIEDELLTLEILLSLAPDAAKSSASVCRLARKLE